MVLNPQLLIVMLLLLCQYHHLLRLIPTPLLGGALVLNLLPQFVPNGLVKLKQLLQLRMNLIHSLMRKRMKKLRRLVWNA